MPATPEAGRPIARTSLSWKRTAWPSRETIRMSSLPSDRRTPISSSPSRIFRAMIPSAFSGVLYSRNSVFLITPFRVAKTRYFDSL